MRTKLMLTVAALIVLLPMVLQAANEDGAALAVLQGGRTLVPVRTVTEWLGADVLWSPEQRQVVIQRGNMSVHLRAESTAALHNGEAVVLDEPPVILGGVTYVPARFVAEAFGASVEFSSRGLTLEAIGDERRMDLRVAVRDGDWLTYRGPWFDIDYPASFRPLGYDRAPRSDDYDEDGMRFGSPGGTVEFYVYSPLWSGSPGWPTVWPAETVLQRTTNAEGSGIERKSLTWVTLSGPQDEYTRSWIEIHQPELNVRHYFGIRYTGVVAYDRWRDEYEQFKDSLVQYAD